VDGRITEESVIIPYNPISSVGVITPTFGKRRWAFLFEAMISRRIETV
jgi:hypothetical protein